jgi:cell division protease FtsH
MKTRRYLIWIFPVLLFMLAMVVVSDEVLGPDQEVEYSELIARLEKGELRAVTVEGQIITATTTSDETLQAIGPSDHEGLARSLAEHHIVPNYRRESDGNVMSLLTSGVTMIIVVALFVLGLQQIQANGSRALTFGKSRARLLNESSRKVTFSDVAGAEEAKDELDEIVQYLREPARYQQLGGRIPKGVLLMGPPGTGKTLLARAVAGEAGVPFFTISGSDFVEMFVGVGASRVRDLFEQGKNAAPCIIFIDEIDAVGRHRGAGMGGGHDEREQTLNQLLVEMDGFESTEGVILMAATNRPDVLDPALLRPGRFDRRVAVTNPDVRGRVEILKVHVRKTPLAPDVDLEVIARGTPGFSGADLQNLVNEAALLAARLRKTRLEMVDFESSKDKVWLGAERRSLVISDRERKRTAYHEAGHAIVARLLPDADPVHKITIVPRGRALGLTQILPDEDRLCHTVAQLRTSLTILMGGRAAEDIALDEMTSGAADDLRKATRMARAMVTEWGMSENLGPMSLHTSDGEVFLGRDLGRVQEYSEQTARLVDAEIKQLLDDAYSMARNILHQNIGLLHRLADLLVEKETVDAADFEALVSAAGVVPPTNARSASLF